MESRPWPKVFIWFKVCVNIAIRGDKVASMLGTLVPCVKAFRSPIGPQNSVADSPNVRKITQTKIILTTKVAIE